MKVFTDAAGREWEIALDAALLKRVWDVCGVDLGSPDEGDTPLYYRLMTGAGLFCSILPALCWRQLEKRSMAPDQFLAGMPPSVIAAAREAFLAEWCDFFQLLGEPAKAKVLDAGMKYYRLRMVKASEDPAVQKLEEALATASRGD